MTRAEWLELKPGDVIIEVRSGTERRIISVTHTKNPNAQNIRTCITMKKVGYGWTKGPNTTYNNSDDRGRWRLKR